MKMQNLEDLLHDQVRDLYDAEKQLVKACPQDGGGRKLSRAQEGF